jgi:hypothetical protein
VSRGLSTTNTTQVDAAHLHEVVLVKLEFDTPVYVHSGIGNISYDGNTYLGVGDLGGISALRESEALGPAAVTLTLDGTDSDYITEALDSGNLYDKVTIYEGYRQDDGTLYDDPWIAWKGWFEYASVSLGEQAIVEVTCQHDLSVLNEKDGGRYSDEDQQDAYTGDVGFEFVAATVGVKLVWGGRRVGGTGPSRPRDDEAQPIND